MSILETFSLEYRMAKNRSKIKPSMDTKISNNKDLQFGKYHTHNITHHQNNQQQTKQQILERKNTFSLQAKIINKLIALGYKMESIVCLAKQKNFNSIEEALNFLEKDPDSNLYNHYFCAMNSPNNNLCKICQHGIKEHIKEDEDLSPLKDIKNKKGKYFSCINGNNDANFQEDIKKNSVKFNSVTKKRIRLSINKGRTPINLNLNIVSGNNINNITQETNNTCKKINKDDNNEASQFPLLLGNNPKFSLNNNSDILLINKKEKYKQLQSDDQRKRSVGKSTINYNISINIKKPIRKQRSKLSNIITPVSIKTFKTNNLEILENEENNEHSEDSYYNEYPQANTTYKHNNFDIDDDNNTVININKNINIENSNNIDNNKNIIINNNNDENINIKIPTYCKIEIPKETLESFQDPDICPICYANKVNKNNIAQKNCKHKFCDKCITTYLTQKIINGEVLNIRCLMGGCKHLYTKEEIKSNVPPNIFNKYIKFYQIQIKLKNPNKIYINCAQIDCEELIDVTNINEGNVKCKLGHIFCRKCYKIGGHLPNDPPCNIDDLNQDFFNELNKKNSYNVRIKYKQCPQCKVLIEKIDGCNQMKCINCGFNFCWLCLKEYTSNHYSLYNTQGCPGMRFETERMYRIRNNSCYNCLWHLLSCLLGVLMFIGIYLFYLFCGCAYEFVKCYRNRGKKNSSRDISINDVINLDDGSSSYSRRINLNVLDNGKKDNKYVLWLVIGLGILCQPLYLSFYLLYALIECYRRFNCMFYLPD